MLNGVDPVAKPAGVDASYWNALVPEGNESTPERFALGKKLFFDRRLSSDGTVSCATCHDVSRGFADDRPTSEGVGGKLGVRNSPTAACSAFFYRLFWDGRSPNLEHQALQPIVNRREMGRPLDSEGVVAEIADDPEYKAMFQAAYGRDVNYADVGNALAVFERGLNFTDNPFFRYLRGDENAISADAKEGWKIFNDRGRCVSCHQISPSNPVGTNHKFHNIGVDDPAPDFATLAKRAATALNESSLPERTTEELAFDPELNKLGRFNVTELANDVGGFRTQQLLNVGVTAPYMRDGSIATLWDVVDHYNKGGEPSLAHDGGIEPLNLSERQVEQLVAFLFSLTDVRFGAENAREFERQRAVATQRRPERDDAAASRRTLLFERFAPPEKTNVANETDETAVELTPTGDAPGKNVGSISETETTSASERALEGAEKKRTTQTSKTPSRRWNSNRRSRSKRTPSRTRSFSSFRKRTNRRKPPKRKEKTTDEPIPSREFGNPRRTGAERDFRRVETARPPLVFEGRRRVLGRRDRRRRDVRKRRVSDVAFRRRARAEKRRGVKRLVRRE